MQSTHDMEFRYGGRRLGSCFQYLLQGHGVGVVLRGVFAESAEPAAIHADIGVIDMAILIEIDTSAAFALVQDVSHPAEAKKVVAVIELHCLRHPQALASQDFVGNLFHSAEYDICFHGKKSP